MATLWHQYGYSMASPWERREKGVAAAWEGFGNGLARDTANSEFGAAKLGVWYKQTWSSVQPNLEGFFMPFWPSVFAYTSPKLRLRYA